MPTKKKSKKQSTFGRALSVVDKVEKFFGESPRAKELAKSVSTYSAITSNQGIDSVTARLGNLSENEPERAAKVSDLVASLSQKETKRIFETISKGGKVSDAEKEEFVYKTNRVSGALVGVGGVPEIPVDRLTDVIKGPLGSKNYTRAEKEAFSGELERLLVTNQSKLGGLELVPGLLREIRDLSRKGVEGQQALVGSLANRLDTFAQLNKDVLLRVAASKIEEVAGRVAASKIEEVAGRVAPSKIEEVAGRVAAKEQEQAILPQVPGLVPVIAPGVTESPTASVSDSKSPEGGRTRKSPEEQKERASKLASRAGTALDFLGLEKFNEAFDVTGKLEKVLGPREKSTESEYLDKETFSGRILRKLKATELRGERAVVGAGRSALASAKDILGGIGKSVPIPVAGSFAPSPVVTPAVQSAVEAVGSDEVGAVRAPNFIERQISKVGTAVKTKVFGKVEASVAKRLAGTKLGGVLTRLGILAAPAGTAAAGTAAAGTAAAGTAAAGTAAAGTATATGAGGLAALLAPVAAVAGAGLVGVGAGLAINRQFIGKLDDRAQEQEGDLAEQREKLLQDPRARRIDEIRKKERAFKFAVREAKTPELKRQAAEQLDILAAEKKEIYQSRVREREAGEGVVKDVTNSLTPNLDDKLKRDLDKEGKPIIVTPPSVIVNPTPVSVPSERKMTADDAGIGLLNLAIWS